MIAIERRGKPPHGRKRALQGPWIVLLFTFAAIALFAWNMRPAVSPGAVVRISLAKVPEERVVAFGHEGPSYDFVFTEEELAAPAVGAFAAPARQDSAPAAPPTPRSARVASSRVRPDANGVLPIGYSLPGGVSSEQGGVSVAKTLAAENGGATGLTIFLIGGAVIEVDRGELVSALARLGAQERANGLPPAGETGRLSLDRVRTAGVDLRYDAVHDRLVLRP